MYKQCAPVSFMKSESIFLLLLFFTSMVSINSSHSVSVSECVMECMGIQRFVCCKCKAMALNIQQLSSIEPLNAPLIIAASLCLTVTPVQWNLDFLYFVCKREKVLMRHGSIHGPAYYTYTKTVIRLLEATIRENKYPSACLLIRLGTSALLNSEIVHRSMTSYLSNGP